MKVLDFGLAKLVSARSRPKKTQPARLGRVPKTGTIMGTAAYMSPEQAQGRAVDTRSDIFAFGAVLYEMLTGRRAFQGTTHFQYWRPSLRTNPNGWVGSSVASRPNWSASLHAACARTLRGGSRTRLI